MQRKLPTIYANVINIRTTTAEMVLDFGTFFPDNPQAAIGVEVPVPEDFEPEVRIIMSVVALRKLGEMFLHAAEQHEKASKQVAAPSVRKEAP